MHATFLHDLSTTLQIAVEIEFNLSPVIPAKVYGDPYDCHPEEGGELEILSLFISEVTDDSGEESYTRKFTDSLIKNDAGVRDCQKALLAWFEQQYDANDVAGKKLRDAVYEECAQAADDEYEGRREMAAEAKMEARRNGRRDY